MAKKLSCLILLLLFSFSSILATESRIETMGKRDLFFRDDISIYSNPANISLMGNYISGTLGMTTLSESTDTTYKVVLDDSNVPSIDTSLITGKNSSLTNQWFGASYNFDVSKDFSFFLGLAFNRVDEDLQLFNNIRTREEGRWINSGRQELPSELEAITEILFGTTLMNKYNVGFQWYHASQNTMRAINEDQLETGYNAGINKMNLGLTMDIAKHSLEVYTGLTSFSNELTELKDKTVSDIIENKTGSVINLGTRFFYATNIGGGVVIVPALKLKSYNILSDEGTIFSAGCGMNLRIDKGFFWAGLEGEYINVVAKADSMGNKDILDSSVTENRLHLNFGIEKSMIWDWFMIRVGGHKYLGSLNSNSNGQTLDMYTENESIDGSVDDFIGFGISLNYQNRLRFDITLNEALPFFNPFGNGIADSNNGENMLIRISSTFKM